MSLALENSGNRHALLERAGAEKPSELDTVGVEELIDNLRILSERFNATAGDQGDQGDQFEWPLQPILVPPRPPFGLQQRELVYAYAERLMSSLVTLSTDCKVDYLQSVPLRAATALYLTNPRRPALVAMCEEVMRTHGAEDAFVDMVAYLESANPPFDHSQFPEIGVAKSAGFFAGPGAEQLLPILYEVMDDPFSKWSRKLAIRTLCLLGERVNQSLILERFGEWLNEGVMGVTEKQHNFVYNNRPVESRKHDFLIDDMVEAIAQFPGEDASRALIAAARFADYVCVDFVRESAVKVLLARKEPFVTKFLMEFVTSQLWLGDLGIDTLAELSKRQDYGVDAFFERVVEDDNNKTDYCFWTYARGCLERRRGDERASDDAFRAYAETVWASVTGSY